MQADIQGLRGVAVLLVVLYHAGLPWLPGGFAGVDVFFVISGYLITGLLVREVQTQGRVHLLNFLARRARRLLPAAIALVALLACAALWLYPPLERTDIIAAARAASLYGANLWFAFRAVDYLGGHAAVNPMLHMWSLGVEEQFYLLWPLIVSLAAARRRAGDATRRVFWMVVVVTLVTFLACLCMTRYSQPWAFFGTPFRAWEFGLGALVVLMRPRLLVVPPPWIGIVGCIGAAAVVASALALDHRSTFPGPWALLPAAGTALVLAALQPGGPRALHAVLAFRPLARVGDVSYSWYLWHWPLIVMTPVLHPQGGGAAVALAVSLSYLAAEASYRWIEQPFRTGRAARAVPRLAVAAALATTVLTAGTLTMLHERAQHAPISAAQQTYIAARKDIPAVYALGCHVAFKVQEAIACDAGDVNANRVIVLLGDSHAAHWFPALDEIGRRNGWRLVSMTKSACPWVETPVRLERGGYMQPYPECEVWRRNALDKVANLKPAMVIVASGSRYANVTPTQWKEGARRTLDRLQLTGSHLVVLRDTPWPQFNVPTCLARADQRGAAPAEACAFDRSVALDPGRDIFDAERRAAAGVAGVAVVNLSPALCPESRCAALADGHVRFSDHSHLTASYARSLAPALGRLLQL